MDTNRHEPRDAAWEDRVRANFARQQMMQLLGAELTDVRPGEVGIALPFRDELTQQHGYVHAAAITAIADSAAGYAALTLMAPGLDVLSVEFKVNLLAPAEGARFVATGSVLRPGRTLTVCTAEVHAERGDGRHIVAAMQATMIAVPSRDA